MPIFLQSGLIFSYHYQTKLPLSTEGMYSRTSSYTYVSLNARFSFIWIRTRQKKVQYHTQQGKMVFIICEYSA